MSATQHFLTQQSDIHDLTDFDAMHSGFVIPLADTGLIALSNTDASTLLQRLLTNDVERMKPSEACLSGLCSPQGRLLATFLIFKTDDRIVLQLPIEIQANIQKRLQMYVMRDQVDIADANEEYALLGIGGSNADTALKNWFPQLPSEPYALIQNDSGMLIRVANAFGTARYEWVLSPAMLDAAWPTLTASLTPQPDAAWRLANIDAGIPTILSATQEQFVPQMVNFEVIGGVSFKKGCFIGQEVIARTQYRGRTPRRMLAASIEASLDQAQAGTAVYASNDPSQPCGMIVNAARSMDDTIACLVSLRLDTTESSTVQLGEAGGPTLQLKPLPYALPQTEE